MLERSQLERTLTTLVKGKSDFALFGNKSSGKTFLLKKILDSVYGPNKYLTIKCIFISDRASLLYLVGEEMEKLFKSLSSDLMNEINFEKEYQNLGLWLADINKSVAKHEEFFKKLPPIYILMDNIQSFNLNQSFFKNFYYGIKRELKNIKISFIFSGISMMSPLFYINEPLRLLPTFVMPQPDIRGIIISGVDESQLAQRLKSMEKGQKAIIEKLLKVLKSNLEASFEATEFEIERTIRITKQFMKYINQYIGQKPQLNANALLKNEETIKQAFKKLHEHGPVSLERVMSENIKKQTGQHEVQEEQPTFYLENYPSLLATSLGLANGYPQTEDLKRFMDLTKVKSQKQKATMKYKNSDFGFKRQSKKIRHNAMRIIGISEVLEQQSNCPKRLMERNRDIYPHHTLDYYGCIQYLRDEGYLSYYGKTSGKFGGTITGTAKQSEVKDFLNKIGLQYKQFTGID